MLTLQSPVVTICTTSLTFNNSTFCPHSVFVRFVWISQQTAITSLYSINWLVFITETEDVYCAVRTGSMLIIEITPSKFTGHYMCTQSNKNPSAWNFQSPELEVTWRTVAIIIRVVLLSHLCIRGVSLSSIHYNQSHRTYINRRHQYICLIWN